MEPEQQVTQQIIELVVPYQESRAEALAESDGLFVKAIGVEYTRVFSTGNYESAKFTVSLWADRDGSNDLEADLETLWQTAKESVKEQALPVLRARDAKHVQPAPEPQPSPTPDSTSGPPLPPPGSGASQPPTGASSGPSSPPPAGSVPADHKTSDLVKLMVQADGKVEFYVQGLRWPLKDARGAERVIQLFDPALGWNVQHLSPGALYEGATVAGIKVDWYKNEKGYRDVLRVYR